MSNTCDLDAWNKFAESNRDHWADLRPLDIFAAGFRSGEARIRSLEQLVEHVLTFHEDKHSGPAGDCRWDLCEHADELSAAVGEPIPAPQPGGDT